LQVIANGSDGLNLPGKTLSLTPLSTLGAEADNDIILNDQYVSAHHARLTWDGSSWWIEDLGSANGTTIDGNRCLRTLTGIRQAGSQYGLRDGGSLVPILIRAAALQEISTIDRT
jgi:pSer/pThr/pTyr-binding forkhead associated (FHA) protein